jgi:hypothetical protein
MTFLGGLHKNVKLGYTYTYNSVVGFLSVAWLLPQTEQITCKEQNLRTIRQWSWRLLSSVMQYCTAWWHIANNVSEESTTAMIMQICREVWPRQHSVRTIGGGQHTDKQKQVGPLKGLLFLLKEAVPSPKQKQRRQYTLQQVMETHPFLEIM